LHIGRHIAPIVVGAPLPLTCVLPAGPTFALILNSVWKVPLAAVGVGRYGLAAGPRRRCC